MLRIQSGAQNRINNDSTTTNHLNTWQGSVDDALNKFLSQTKSELLNQSMNAGMVLISYSADISELPEIDKLAKRLMVCLQAAGLKVLLSHLVDGKSLEQDLAQAKFAIILASPAYVKVIQNFPQIKAMLDNFGQGQKNALHTLLCSGGFSDVAFNVVAPNYLVRDFRAIVKPNHKQDALFSEHSFIDIFLNMTGANGLGVLPDILSLNNKGMQIQAAIYVKLWDELEEALLNLTIDYRLKSAAALKVENHPLKAYQYKNQAQQLSITGIQTPGLTPALQSFLQGDAKISLWLGETSADVELLDLAVAQYLLEQSKMYVLSIECGLYPGKAAADCVHQELIRLQIKEIDAVRNKPIIILLRNYQDIGVYDNVYAQNRLSAWPNLKVIVTCRADFFQTRGYLKCFLPDASNRRVEDLLVYRIPAFASMEAQKAATSINYQAEINASTNIIAMSPKRTAQLLELSDFLKELRNSWIEAGDLKSTLVQNPQAFISYAWESDKEALNRQQQHLSRLAHDLTTVGLPTWLDIEQMSGDIDKQMADNIANSQIAIIIGTPRYTERASQDTNVHKEYQAIMARASHEQNTDKFTIVPIKFLAETPSRSTLPADLLVHANVVDLHNIDDGADYIYRLTDPEIGLIPKLLVKNPQQRARYQLVFANFQNELKRLVGKHLVVNQGKIDAQSYDMQARLRGQLTPFGLANETNSLTQRFDLKSDFTKFLGDARAKTYVLLGRAGSGKSLFAMATFTEQLQTWQNYLPLYIALREYTQYPDTCIERALQQQFKLEAEDIKALKQGLGAKQKLLFILDGYDELGSGVRPNFTQALADWPTAKLLITSRPEHFDSNHTPSRCLQLMVQNRSQIGAVQQIYVSLFSPEDITAFVAIRGKGKDTISQLQRLPGLMELLSNPFLLTLVLQALPKLLKNRLQNTNNKAVTRVEVYEAFTQTWFSQETQGRDLNTESCEIFSQDLAFELFKNKVIGLPIQFETCNTSELKALWKFFNNQQVAARQDAAPMRNSGGIVSFLHKSVYEYFVAAKLWRAVKKADEALEDLVSKWSERRLTEEPPVIEFLAQLYQAFPEESCLFSLIERSRDETFPEIASANAATLLNAAGVKFSYRDLSQVRIPGADMDESICESTNFSGSDLTGVGFDGAWLNHSKFIDANMQDVDFGLLPTLQLKERIYSCAYSYYGVTEQRGRWLALGVESSIELYEMPTGKLVKKLIGHSGTINSVAFSQDGKWLVSGSSDKTIRLWSNLESKRATARVLNGHDNGVNSVAFSQDGKWLASGSSDKTIRLWSNLESKRPTARVLKDHTDGVNSVAFSQDGKFLASGSSDKTIRLWSNLESKRATVRVLKDHTDNVNSVAFSQDGKWLASGSSDNTVRLWNFLDQNELTSRELIGHTWWVMSVAFSPDGQQLVSASYDCTLRVWTSLDLDRPAVKELSGHTEPLYCVAINPDGASLVSGGWDTTARLWSLSTKTKIPKMRGKTLDVGPSVGGVSRMLLSPNKQCLATVFDKSLGFWKGLGGNDPVMEVLGEHASAIKGIVFSPDGQLLASADSKDHVILIWYDLDNMPMQRMLEWVSIENVASHIVCGGHLAFSPNGQFLASGCNDNVVRLWDITKSSAHAIQVLQGHTSGIKSILFSQDGDLLASADDKTVLLWSAFDQEVVTMRALEGPASESNTAGPEVGGKLAFSPDSCLLAVVYNDGTNSVWLWSSIQHGKKPTRRVLEGHVNEIKRIAFSPDGQLLASADGNAAIRLWWDLSQDSPSVLVLEWSKKNNPYDYISAFAFSPDGKTIASAHYFDKVLLIWEVKNGRLLSVVRLAFGITTLCWNKNLLITGQSDGAISVWSISESAYLNEHEDLVNINLVWRLGKPAPVSAFACVLNGANLSENNRLLLYQANANLDSSDKALMVNPLSHQSSPMASMENKNVPSLSETEEHLYVAKPMLFQKRTRGGMTVKSNSEQHEPTVHENQSSTFKSKCTIS